MPTPTAVARLTSGEWFALPEPLAPLQTTPADAFARRLTARLAIHDLSPAKLELSDDAVFLSYRRPSGAYEIAVRAHGKLVHAAIRPIQSDAVGAAFDNPLDFINKAPLVCKVFGTIGFALTVFGTGYAFFADYRGPSGNVTVPGFVVLLLGLPGFAIGWVVGWLIGRALGMLPAAGPDAVSERLGQIVLDEVERLAGASVAPPAHVAAAPPGTTVDARPSDGAFDPPGSSTSASADAVKPSATATSGNGAATAASSAAASPDTDRMRRELLGLGDTPMARPLHYHFAHKVLPALLWRGDSLLGILANPANTEFLPGLWADVARRGPESDRFPAQGLRCSSHWLGGEDLVLLIEFPVAERPAEAYFAAISTLMPIRYLTLERTLPTPGVERPTVLCEWARDGKHRNYGDGPEPERDLFLRSVCRRLGVAETIESPTERQCQGMAKTATFDMTMPEELAGDDLAQAEQWESDADAAREAGDPGAAETLWRRIIAFRLALQGPENTRATLRYMPLVYALLEQAKHAEAERVCRDWWRLCRRHRMLGHAETMNVTRMLAECHRAAGRADDSVRVMEYRALLAGAARGADSIEGNATRRELESAKENARAGAGGA